MTSKAKDSEIPAIDNVVETKPETVSLTMEALASQFITQTKLINENMQLREYVAKLEAYIKDSEKKE